MAREIIDVSVEHVREYNSFLRDHDIDFKSIQQGSKTLFYLNANDEKIKLAEEYAADMTTGYMWFKFVDSDDDTDLLIEAAIAIGLTVYGEKKSFFLRRKMIAFKGDEKNLALYARLLHNTDEFLDKIQK